MGVWRVQCVGYGKRRGLNSNYSMLSFAHTLRYVSGCCWRQMYLRCWLLAAGVQATPLGKNINNKPCYCILFTHPLSAARAPPHRSLTGC